MCKSTLVVRTLLNSSITYIVERARSSVSVVEVRAEFRVAALDSDHLRFGTDQLQENPRRQRHYNFEGREKQRILPSPDEAHRARFWCHTRQPSFLSPLIGEKICSSLICANEKKEKREKAREGREIERKA